ncbi:MAG: DUF559 domain-containing protein [Propioniciclava sp.]|uniref:DUF559 domain-containing protein n=1 Tax=Propioniciclava sp. TaxID=2038686 RepID=UPI0039E41FAA
MNHRFDDLADDHGLVVARTAADRRRLVRAVRAGRMIEVAPGVHAAADRSITPALRALALSRRDPDGVIVGAAAAQLLWWPGVSAEEIVVSRSTVHPPFPGFRWTQAGVPAELIAERHGLRLASPALSALQLASTLGGRAIDEAFRRRACSLADLHGALDLIPGRPGNTRLRALLRDSRDEPWSEAERALHHEYRSLRLGLEYRTNHPVALLDRSRAYLDLALPALMLALEVDGYAFHHDRVAFERDRDRDLQLTCLGWQVVRISASAFLDDPVTTRARMLQVIGVRAETQGLRIAARNARKAAPHMTTWTP